MQNKKKILVINGSASENSSNERLIERIADLAKDRLELTVFNDLKKLPQFDPKLSSDNPPASIVDFRKKIEDADGVIISTPEYIFSVPSGVKNSIEWCVAVVVFTDKPLGIVTASAHGAKGHEELMMIMRTVGAKFTDETTLLIQGIKGKINIEGQITHDETRIALEKFTTAFGKLVGA
jgi:NAD(P)H-dependent FMN reductase